MTLYEKKINEKKRELFVTSAALLTVMMLGNVVGSKNAIQLQIYSTVDEAISEIEQYIDEEDGLLVDIDDENTMTATEICEKQSSNSLSDRTKTNEENKTTLCQNTNKETVSNKGQETVTTEQKTIASPSKNDTNNKITQSTVQNEEPTKNTANSQISNSNENAVEEKKTCISHNLVLTKTTVVESYQFCNYITDYYECQNCNYKESRDHKAAKSVSSATIASAESEVVAAVNRLRVENGLSQLWTNSTWDSWADKRANEIATNYSHSGWTHKEENTYTLAENITAGQSSSSEIYNAFLNSAQHKSAMLQKNAVGIAVGIYIASDGTVYCAMSIIAEK